MARYGMVIDLHRCFGCQACAAACKVANNLPKELVYNRVLTTGGATATDCAYGEYPNCTLGFQPTQCMHCEEPACAEVCPTGATYKDENGIVCIDADLCIGCQACIKACPYEGVRTLVPENPTYYLDVVVGEIDAPAHTPGIVEKCTFCKNLVERGEDPACMQLCPGRARYWGDLDDPEAEVSKLLASGREVVVLNEDAGTSPKVFYLP